MLYPTGRGPASWQCQHTLPLTFSETATRSKCSLRRAACSQLASPNDYPFITAMLRILSDLHSDGPTQMALDEALLNCAQSPCIRLYSWNPATVSLGYFQPYDLIAASLPRPMPLVRRITGGGAIWHEHEITYSLVGFLGKDGMPHKTADCYPLIHGAVQAELGKRHAPVARQQQSIGDKRYHDEPRCFASPAADDLVSVNSTTSKILGSAGRTRGQRVLIHGSLKYDTNIWDQDRVTGCGLSATDTREALMTALMSLFPDLTPEQTELTDQEQTHRDKIRHSRYDTDDWVHKRQGPRP